jgi:hypothetical protein
VTDAGSRSIGEDAMKTGDVSRKRRLRDPARIREYARRRAERFARRMLGSDSRTKS